MKKNQEKQYVQVIKFTKQLDKISKRLLFVMACAEVGTLIASASADDLLNPAVTSVTGLTILSGTAYLTNARILNNTKTKLTRIQNQRREENINKKRA